MVYKIRWKTGGETAERYVNLKIAKSVLKKSNLSGDIIKTKLGSAGRTAPFYEWKYGDKQITNFPKGKKLIWVKHNGVYRTHVI